MYGRGLVFTNDGSTESVREEYERKTNRLETFISGNYESDAEGYVSKQEFRNNFEDWLKSQGARLWTEKDLSSAMKKDLGYEDAKKLVDGKGRQNCWLGLRPKEIKRW